jgi:hypothetical protein
VEANLREISGLTSEQALEVKSFADSAWTVLRDVFEVGYLGISFFSKNDSLMNKYMYTFPGDSIIFMPAGCGSFYAGFEKVKDELYVVITTPCFIHIPSTVFVPSYTFAFSMSSPNQALIELNDEWFLCATLIKFRDLSHFVLAPIHRTDFLTAKYAPGDTIRLHSTHWSDFINGIRDK